MRRGLTLWARGGRVRDRLRRELGLFLGLQVLEKLSDAANHRPLDIGPYMVARTSSVEC
jgi:hypothetical protein